MLIVIVIREYALVNKIADVDMRRSLNDCSWLGMSVMAAIGPRQLRRHHLVHLAFGMLVPIADSLELRDERLVGLDCCLHHFIADGLAWHTNSLEKLETDFFLGLCGLEVDVVL